MSNFSSDPVGSGSASFPQGTPASPKPEPTNGRRRRRSVSTPATLRVTAYLGPAHSVTISGPDLDLPRVITLLSDTLAKARKAHSQNMRLVTFISLLRDQAAIRLPSHPAE